MSASIVGDYQGYAEMVFVCPHSRISVGVVLWKGIDSILVWLRLWF